MGFPNESAGSISVSSTIARDPYSMDSALAELNSQVSRLIDLELALNQRLAPILKPNQSTDEAVPLMMEADVPPMTNRARFVGDQASLLRQTINRIYDMLDYVDA